MTQAESSAAIATALALNSSEVHLWLTFCAEAQDSALIDRYRTLLSQAECAQCDRFHFARDRHRYLVTRALVRTVLSRYASVAPADWRFEATPHGRPMIVNEDDSARTLSFNLTHTSDLIALVVTRERAIGVDTENIDRGAMLELADRYFAPRECQGLKALPAGDQALRFFELWTLKESYIKARGLGLSIPLDRFSFDLRETGKVTLSIESELHDAPERWAVCQLWPTPQHPLALCVERLPDQPFDLIARKLVPLQAESRLNLPSARSN
jgi:4'-phosphopantetheinyl transferase